MRLDARTLILSMWLTLGAGTVASSLTYDYILGVQEVPPMMLSQTAGLMAGMILAAVLSGMAVAFVNWAETPQGAIYSGVVGYLMGAFVRLAFWGRLLPGSSGLGEFVWNLVRHAALAEYHVFLLMVLLGGALVVVLSTVFAGQIWATLELLPELPLEIDGRTLGTLVALPPLLLVSAILLRTLDASLPEGIAQVGESSIGLRMALSWLVILFGIVMLGGYLASMQKIYIQVGGIALAVFGSARLAFIVPLEIQDLAREGAALVGARWVTLPQSNMILAAIVGFVIGASHMARNRGMAARLGALVMMAHVIAMLVLDSPLASYDSTYAGQNFNQAHIPTLFFFWLGTPVVGGIGAYAMHNLRDAYQMQAEEFDEQFAEYSDSEV